MGQSPVQRSEVMSSQQAVLTIRVRSEVRECCGEFDRGESSSRESRRRRRRTGRPARRPGTSGNCGAGRSGSSGSSRRPRRRALPVRFTRPSTAIMSKTPFEPAQSAVTAADAVDQAVDQDLVDLAAEPGESPGTAGRRPPSRARRSTTCGPETCRRRRTARRCAPR